MHYFITTLKTIVICVNTNRRNQQEQKCFWRITKEFTVLSEIAKYSNDFTVRSVVSQGEDVSNKYSMGIHVLFMH